MGKCTDLMNLVDFDEVEGRSGSETGEVVDADGGEADAIEVEAEATAASGGAVTDVDATVES